MSRMKRSLGALTLALLFLFPLRSFAEVFVSINIAPPPLPVYEQPECPAPDYIWTPGYWAYGPEGYYWVPGTWVEAPQPGYLWTPGYWGWNEGNYIWHGGYWGPTIGFYGGVNYGFGYFGDGYAGGRWGHDGHFEYNRAVTRVNVVNIHNVYNTRIVNNYSHSRVSFNGGNGGLRARPTARQEEAARGNHIAATAAQMQHEHSASSDRGLLASVNHGRPSIAASQRPGAFSGPGVVRARAAGGPMPRGITHAGEAGGRPAASAGNAMPRHANGGTPSAGFAPHPSSAGGARPESAGRPAPIQPNHSPTREPQLRHAPAGGGNARPEMGSTRPPMSAPREPALSRPQGTMQRAPVQHAAPRPEAAPRMEQHAPAPMRAPAAPHPAPQAHPAAPAHNAQGEHREEHH